MRDNTIKLVLRGQIYYQGTWMSKSQYRQVRKAERMAINKW